MNIFRQNLVKTVQYSAITGENLDH